MDISLLVDEIKLNNKLKSEVLSLVEKDRAKLISLCEKCNKDNFKSAFLKNDLAKLAIALLYSVNYTYPKYQKMGISDDIYFATMKDISIWCENNGNKGLKKYSLDKKSFEYRAF